MAGTIRYSISLAFGGATEKFRPCNATQDVFACATVSDMVLRIVSLLHLLQINVVPLLMRGAIGAKFYHQSCRALPRSAAPEWIPLLFHDLTAAELPDLPECCMWVQQSNIACCIIMSCDSLPCLQSLRVPHVLCCDHGFLIAMPGQPVA